MRLAIVAQARVRVRVRIDAMATTWGASVVEAAVAGT
jgi:hypothetical protein